MKNLFLKTYLEKVLYTFLKSLFQKSFSTKLILEYISCVLEILFQNSCFGNLILEMCSSIYFMNFRKDVRTTLHEQIGASLNMLLFLSANMQCNDLRVQI